MASATSSYQAGGAQSGTYQSAPPPGYAATAQAPFVATGYAGFWRRVVAYFIDALIMCVLYIVLALVLGGTLGAILGGAEVPDDVFQRIFDSPGLAVVLQICSALMVWLYMALQESSRAQATLGKRALGCRVTDTSGNRISFGRATGRHFSKILSGLILGIGFIMVGLTQRKQGLHDKIAETLVLTV